MIELIQLILLALDEDNPMWKFWGYCLSLNGINCNIKSEKQITVVYDENTYQHEALSQAYDLFHLARRMPKSIGLL